MGEFVDAHEGLIVTIIILVMFCFSSITCRLVGKEAEKERKEDELKARRASRANIGNRVSSSSSTPTSSPSSSTSSSSTTAVKKVNEKQPSGDAKKEMEAKEEKEKKGEKDEKKMVEKKKTSEVKERSEEKEKKEGAPPSVVVKDEDQTLIQNRDTSTPLRRNKSAKKEK